MIPSEVAASETSALQPDAFSFLKRRGKPAEASASTWPFSFSLPEGDAMAVGVMREEDERRERGEAKSCGPPL